MITLVWLVAGLAVGVGAEQVVHRFRPSRPAPADGPVPGGGAGNLRAPVPASRAPLGVEPPRKRRRKGRIALISAMVVLLLFVGGGVGLWLWANSVFNRIERVDVGPSLRHGGGRGTNYLLVGTDNRAGVTGNRSDTILLLRVQGGHARMVSIPRDLYVTIAGSGRKQRINAAYNAGARNLVETIGGKDLGLPIDRYLEINFVSFGGLVDAVGGVDVDFPHPAFDRMSGLDVKDTGRVHLDGKQALAYVRSRHFVEVVDGKEQPDPTGDLGREKRQQTFLRSVLSTAGATRNPFKLMLVASSMSKGVRIDDEMTLWDAVGLARTMGGFNPATVELPVTATTLANGAQVLLLDEAKSGRVLADFRD